MLLNYIYVISYIYLNQLSKARLFFSDRNVPVLKILCKHYMSVRFTVIK